MTVVVIHHLQLLISEHVHLQQLQLPMFPLISSPMIIHMPRKDAVDIASYQSWMTQADFNSLKTSGVKSIVVKLTEGTNYTNPYAANQIKMAQNAG